jgi:hypothetical protein
MGYENSKLYRLQHDDGHFYIGSSINELRMRLGQHKKVSKIKPNIRVYQHINGEWDKVKIVLIEVFECSNRDELRRKENEYIQKELKNELCLNHRREHLTEEEAKEYRKEYYERNKDKIKEQGTEYYEANADKVKERVSKYYEANADKIKARARERYAQKKGNNLTANLTEA